MVETVNGRDVLFVDLRTYEGLYFAVMGEKMPKTGFTQLEVGGMPVNWKPEVKYPE